MSKGSGDTDKRRLAAQASLAVGFIAAAFVLVVCTLLTVTHIQLKKADPLNDETLTALRERYAEGDKSEQIKQDIRRLDMLSRKAFFTSQKQINTGGLVAVLAGVVMLAAFGVYKTAAGRIQPPDGDSCEGTFWTGIEKSRAWIAGGAVVLVAISIVMSVSTPTELSEDLLKAEPKQAAGGNPPPSNAPVFPEWFAANAPVFRGAAGTGQTDFEGVPVSWDGETGESVVWKAKVPLPGWASPVVWEDKVVVAGANETKRAVYCFNADTGDKVWTVDLPQDAAATQEYETDTMDERWDLLMYAAATPAVNGEQVFAMFSNGQLAAIDLKSGKVLWQKVLGNTKENTYGLSSGLLIYRDSVIAVFEGDERYIARYDAATGRELWKTERWTPSWASPVLAGMDDGNYRVVLPSDPDITAWDPETGKEVWSTEVFTNEIEYCVGPSPVQVGQIVCVNMQNCGMYGLNLTDGTVAWSIEELPDGSGFSDGPSMTTDGTNIYQFYQSVLSCVVADTGKVVFEKETEEFANYASAVINAGHLYLSSDGMVSVFKLGTGPDLEQVGKGVVGESNDSTLAFVKGRIYMRCDESLYCLGSK